MTERRLAPLSALTTLARRPARGDVVVPVTRVASPPSPPARSRVVDNAVYVDPPRSASRGYSSTPCASRSTVAAYRARRKN